MLKGYTQAAYKNPRNDFLEIRSTLVNKKVAKLWIYIQFKFFIVFYLILYQKITASNFSHARKRYQTLGRIKIQSEVWILSWSKNPQNFPFSLHDMYN